jgi:membrane fusion protein, multidrug efflux system
MQNNEPTIHRLSIAQEGEVQRAQDLKKSEPGRKKPRRQNKWGIVSLFLLFALGASWAVLHYRAAVSKKSTAASARMEQQPVPVAQGTVVQKDVPIFLDGLGTVQAFNTVTVRVRVDGQLQKVAFVEGQNVHPGDLLAQIDPGPYQAQLDQATAKKGQDEAQLNLQRVELKREAELLAAKIDSQDTFDQVSAQVKALEAAVKADEAAIDSAKVQLAYTTITSPIEGRTGLRLVDAGNIVHANDLNGLVVITQLRPICVLFTLPEQSLAGIHKQMTGGELSVVAVDRDNRTVLDQGKLAVVDNQIDTTTGTIKLKANFPNNDLRLWPGQFVNARLLLTTRKNGIVVPAQVIQRGPEGSYAFVIKDDSTVEIRTVRVAQIDDGQALVDDGLSPGEQVVVDGQYKLQANSKVKLTEAGKSGKSGKSGKAPTDLSKPGAVDQ